MPLYLYILSKLNVYLSRCSLETVNVNSKQHFLCLFGEISFPIQEDVDFNHFSVG